MKKLGTVKNITHDGRILLRGDADAAPGEGVYDLRGNPVGRVDRIFGPVARPYISVRPAGRLNPMELVDSTLYLGLRGPGGREGPEKKKGVKQRQRKKRPQRR